MKALVAATRAQGSRPGDFTYAVPGELVYLGMVCARDEQDPDGPGACGCGRAFIGLNSGKATTTAEIREVELTAEHVREAVRSSLEQAGWLSLGGDADAVAQELIEIAADFPVGTVLGRRVDEIFERSA